MADIADYVDELSGNVATGLRVTERLRGHCRKLAASPLVPGRPRPELGEGLRSVPRDAHLIIFKCNAGEIEIVNIVHGRRDVIALYRDKDDIA